MHAPQQQQRQPAMQLTLTDVPTAQPQAAPQVAPKPAVTQPSQGDLLMDAMQQPAAAAAAGVTAEVAAGFLGLLPVQAEKVSFRMLGWLAGCDCCKDSYCPTAALISRKLMSLSIVR
jgi:hypothetical protein